MSIDEFLAFANGTDAAYELVRGEAVVMAPPTARHSRIAGRLATALGSRLRAPCEVFVEAGIVLPARDETYYQADIAVSCSPDAPGHGVSSPRLIAEVLSPSTSGHDKRDKLPDYRTIPSVEEILLVSSTAARVEVHRRTVHGWIVEDYLGREATVLLVGGTVELPLAALFDGLDLPAA
jgi:Uma2 family endonuclease